MKYLTIKEAAKLYGKSPSTIRRLIKIIEDNDLSGKYLKQEKYRKGFRYLIKKKALSLEFGDSMKESRKSSDTIQDSIQEATQDKGCSEKVIRQMSERIKDLKQQLKVAHDQNDRLLNMTNQLMQSMRLEQIKTLDDEQKREILQSLGEGND